MGQLGQTFKALVAQGQAQGLNFIFKTKAALDITNEHEVQKALTTLDYAYCINCAGYTQVDRAEQEPTQAHQINVLGVHHLAVYCQATQTILIHLSTDYVFDGTANIPYTEEAQAKPIGVYGSTKYQGEHAILQNNKSYFIIRTSWLYSEFGHNFMKNMLTLGKERDSLSVVYDQIGSPTYAWDLAQTILKIIRTQTDAYGLYHYSNEGVASWYDFAHAIFASCGMQVRLCPILSEAYPTQVQRPHFSVLNKSKIKEALGLYIPHWKDSLAIALKALKHA